MSGPSLTAFYYGESLGDRLTANRLSVLLFFLEELKGQDTKADNTKEAKDGTHECLRRLTTAGKNGAVVSDGRLIRAVTHKDNQRNRRSTMTNSLRRDP